MVSYWSKSMWGFSQANQSPQLLCQPGLPSVNSKLGFLRFRRGSGESLRISLLSCNSRSIKFVLSNHAHPRACMHAHAADTRREVDTEMMNWWKSQTVKEYGELVKQGELCDIYGKLTRRGSWVTSGGRTDLSSWADALVGSSASLELLCNHAPPLMADQWKIRDFSV